MQLPYVLVGYTDLLSVEEEDRLLAQPATIEGGDHLLMTVAGVPLRDEGANAHAWRTAMAEAINYECARRPALPFDEVVRAFGSAATELPAYRGSEAVVRAMRDRIKHNRATRVQ